MSDSGGKAEFKSDEGGDDFVCQYNPKELKFTRAVSWKKKEKVGSGQIPLEYQKGEPNTLTMELFFDTTAEAGGPWDVRTDWIDGLLQFTSPDLAPSGKRKKARPYVVTFIWKDFEMKGVIDKLDVTYLMFAADGTPVRAKVALSMKEWTDSYEWSGFGSDSNVLDALDRVSAQTLNIVVTAPGDTAASVAASNDVSIQDVCEANNIDDPLAELEAGIELIIDTATSYL
jgi:LysM repeat protein